MTDGISIMDLQTAFNLAVGAGAFLAGWVLNVMWGAIKDMQTADKELTDKVGAIELLVTGQYVSRADYREDLGKIEASLLRIEDKLNSKEDRR